MGINTNALQLFSAMEKWQQNIAGLLIKSENLFKLLWYTDNAALEKPFDSEKMEEIIYEYDSKGNKNPNCQIYFRKFIDETESQERAQLHIYPVQIKKINNYQARLVFRIDVIIESGIDNLRSGFLRRHRMADEIVQAINGKEIQMIGTVNFFDAYMYENAKMPQYDGWSLIFTVGVSAEG